MLIIMGRERLARKLAAEFRDFEVSLKQEFEAVTNICLTADMWSSKRRSYLGVTAHWIVSNFDGSFERKSAAIAIKRFKGIDDFLISRS